MSKFTTLAFAAALAVTVGTSAAQASPYEQDHLVQGVVTNQIQQVFDHQDRTVVDRRIAYLAGFTQWYETRCGFLPAPTFAAIGNAVQNLTRAGHGDATQIGMRDARTFLGEEGCATRTAHAARGSISAFWEAAMRAHERRQGEPGTGQPGGAPRGQGLERQARY